MTAFAQVVAVYAFAAVLMYGALEFVEGTRFDPVDERERFRWAVLWPVALVVIATGLAVGTVLACLGLGWKKLRGPK